MVVATFESAPDGLLVLSRDGEILAFNTAYRALWQFPPEMVARRDAFEWRLHTAAQLVDPQAYLSGIEKLLASEQGGLLDVMALRDGRVFERHVAPLQVPGAPRAVVVRWREISRRHRAEQALQQSQARLQAIFEHASNGILLADDAGICIDANPAACMLLDCGRTELLGQAIGAVVVADAGTVQQAWDTLRRQQRSSGRLQLRRRSGGVVPAQFSAVADIQPGVHMVVLTDLSEALRARRRQEELTALMDLAMMDADLVFWDADLVSGRMSSVNGHWHAMLGYSREEIPDTLDAWDGLVHPEDAARRIVAWEAHLLGHTSTFECEFRIRHKRGHWIWMQARGRVVERAADGEPLRVAGLRMNISARKETEARLQKLAHTDALTGVLNRRRFTELATDELAHAERHDAPVALLMVDLDHFKQVNDRHGHAGGDQVLRAFADTARQVVRQGDLLGRLGGEEFALLLPQTDAEGGGVLAERLRQCIASQQPDIDGQRLSYAVSIGVAAWAPGPAAGPALLDRLLVAADRALYAAKHAGRNRVVVDSVA